MIGHSDELDSQGNALLDLAGVLMLAGRREEAADRSREAPEHFKTKANAVSAARARERLDPLADHVAP